MKLEFRIDLRFGALAPRLAEQIAEQLGEQLGRATAAERNQVKAWQLDADAITRLAVRQLIAESSVRAARRSLSKAIALALHARLSPARPSRAAVSPADASLNVSRTFPRLPKGPTCERARPR